MILENGPKTESCDSGIVVLSKHLSEQTQNIPELLLHKTEKSLHASVMAEALQKIQKENTTLRHTPCHLSLNTDKKNEAGIVSFWKSCDVYKILYRYKCTKIVTKPLWKLPLYPCRKLERMPRLAT